LARRVYGFLEHIAGFPLYLIIVGLHCLAEHLQPRLQVAFHCSEIVGHFSERKR